MEVAANVSVGAAGGGGAVTSKVTGVAADAPIALLQASEKVSVPATDGVRSWLPLVGSGPLQLPDAVQLAAFKADQEIVAELGITIEFGESVKVGTGGATAVKLIELPAEVPAGLVQVRVY